MYKCIFFVGSVSTGVKLAVVALQISGTICSSRYDSFRAFTTSSIISFEVVSMSSYAFSCIWDPSLHTWHFHSSTQGIIFRQLKGEICDFSCLCKTSLLSDVPQSYVWNEDSSFKCMEAFSSSDILHKTVGFKKDYFSDDVNESLNKCSDIFFTACNRSLKRKTKVRFKKTSKGKVFWQWRLCHENRIDMK